MNDLLKLKSDFFGRNYDTSEKSCFLDLRPALLDCKEKINEDKIHDDSEVLTKSEIFYEIFDKKVGHIKPFLNYWFPKIEKFLKPDGVFLEIAGGLNYISAIVKNKKPEMVVCASDISPQYLQKKSKVLADTLFSHTPDFYVACDAENLPFADNSIDFIWTHSSLHHLKSVDKFLSEADRVLKNDGVLIALDTADPILSKRYKRKKMKRAQELGIFENSYTYSEWEKITRPKNINLSRVAKGRIKNKFVQKGINYFIPMNIAFTKTFNPKEF